MRSICCRANLRLLVIQLRGSGARQTPLRAGHNRQRHFQIAQQFGAIEVAVFSCACRCVLKNNSGSSRIRLRMAGECAYRKSHLRPEAAGA